MSDNKKKGAKKQSPKNRPTINFVTIKQKVTKSNERMIPKPTPPASDASKDDPAMKKVKKVLHQVKELTNLNVPRREMPLVQAGSNDVYDDGRGAQIQQRLYFN